MKGILMIPLVSVFAILPVLGQPPTDKDYRCTEPNPSIDENYRCTETPHACVYEFEATGERELELQVSKGYWHEYATCDDIRIWFRLITKEDPWGSKRWWAGDDKGYIDREETEAICRWVLDPESYESYEGYEQLGRLWFEWRPWGMSPRGLGKACPGEVVVPTPPELDLETDYDGEGGGSGGGGGSCCRVVGGGSIACPSDFDSEVQRLKEEHGVDTENDCDLKKVGVEPIKICGGYPSGYPENPTWHPDCYKLDFNPNDAKYQGNPPDCTGCVNSEKDTTEKGDCKSNGLWYRVGGEVVYIIKRKNCQ